MTRTNKLIDYHSAPYGFIATIPAGTPVDPADNLPGTGKFWACAWEEMDDQAAAWHRNYGFLIKPADVETVDDPCPICGDSDCDGSCDHGPGDEPSDIPDNEADAMTLASAGQGTDEDYRRFEEWQGDSDGSVGCD